MNSRLDRPFLDKFFKESTYFQDKREYIDSIIDEISNILSSRLRTVGGFDDNPFNYGIRDLLSLDFSRDDLTTFKNQCRSIILRLEPRISDLEITSLKVNTEKQALNFEIVCVLKATGDKIYPKVIIS